MNLIQHSQGEVGRPLAVLEPLIRKDLEDGLAAEKAAGMPYYRAAGEKIIEAKAQMARGEFQPWLKRKFKISLSSAHLYMQYAHATGVTQKPNALHQSLSDFQRSLGHSKPTSGAVRRDYHCVQTGAVQHCTTTCN